MKGERLKRFREHLGLNQSEFAAKIDTSQPHLSAMENGSRQISADIMVKVSEVYDKLNLDWLHHGRGEMLFSKRAKTPTQSSTPDTESAHPTFQNGAVGSMVFVTEFDDYVVFRKK